MGNVATPVKNLDSNEKKLLLENSLLQKYRRGKINFRNVFIIIFFMCIESLNLLNYSTTMICTRTEFQSFWANYTQNLFLVLYFGSYFLGRCIGSIIINFFLNFTEFVNILHASLVVSFLCNFVPLFNLAPLEFLQLNDNPFVIILLRLFLGFSSSNTVLIRDYILCEFKQNLFSFCLLFGIVEFLFYAISPIIGTFVKMLLDLIITSIPTLPDFFFYPLFDTYTFINLFLGVLTFVLFLFSFFVLKGSSFSFQRKLLKPEPERNPLRTNIHTITLGRHRIVLAIMFAILSWVLLYICLVYNNLPTFITTKLEIIFSHSVISSAILFLIPVVSVVVFYPIFYFLRYLTVKYQPNFLLSNQKQYKLYALLIFTFVCLVYSVSVISFSYFQFNSFEFIIVLFVFSISTSVILPVTISGVMYFFVYALDNVFQKSQKTTFFGYYVFVESLTAIVSLLIILYIEEYSIFIVGFAGLLIGIACFTITIYIFNESDKISNGSEKEKFSISDISVLSSPPLENLVFKFYMIENEYSVNIDNSNRLIVNVNIEDALENVVSFHRYFQHKHIFRIKGHVRDQNCVIFEKINPEFEIMTLKTFLKMKRKKLLWNDKIHIAQNVIEIIQEMNNVNFWHGSLSSWNIIVLVKNNILMKYKMVYLGTVKDRYRPFEKKYDRDTDVNCIGSFIVELFHEECILESLFLNQIKEKGSIEIPFSMLKVAPEDELHYPLAHRKERWKLIQLLLNECLVPHPMVSPEYIRKELQNCKLVIQKKRKSSIDDEEEFDTCNIKQSFLINNTTTLFEIEEEGSISSSTNDLEKLSKMIGKILYKLDSMKERGLLQKEFTKYKRICKTYKRGSTIRQNAYERIKSLVELYS